jgi:hypothetical protein
LRDEFRPLWINLYEDIARGPFHLEKNGGSPMPWSRPFAKISYETSFSDVRVSDLKLVPVNKKTAVQILEFKPLN